MSDHQARYPIATMCRLLGVSPSGWYAWCKRQASSRSKRDAELATAIRAAHTASRGTYCGPPIHAELAANYIHIGRKRIARLMSQCRTGGSYNATTGVYIFTGTAAEATAALEALQFTPNAPSSGNLVATTSLTVTVTGVGGTASNDLISVTTVTQAFGLNNKPANEDSILCSARSRQTAMTVSAD